MSTGGVLSGYYNALYTGNGTTLDIPCGFNPDLTIIRRRTSVADYSYTFDSAQGVGNYLLTNSGAAKTTNVNSLTAFASGGFTVGNSSIVNTNAANYISWNWRKDTAYFDIVSFTGTGSSQNINHNLGVAPSFMILKDASTGVNWAVYHISQGATKAAPLDSFDGFVNAPTIWDNTPPTSAHFSVGVSGTVNSPGNSVIAYLWAEKPGISAFGSYVGNGGTKSVTTYVPAKTLLLFKVTSGGHWTMINASMGSGTGLYLNGTDSLNTSLNVTLDATGFTIVGSDDNVNANGATYVYAAWA